MSKEMNYQVLAAKYLEFIKRTAIDIKADPVKVLELKSGDVVLIGEVLLEVEALKHEPDLIFLTTLDSDVATYHNSNGIYQEDIKHLRDLSHAAVMERIEMKKILESGEYTIS